MTAGGGARVRSVRAGLFLAYWPWFTPQEQVELAVLADELGLDSVWVSEAWGQDAVSVLGLLAGKTERVALGSGLMQIPARQPAATAMAAATLDVLSGGRFRLGLGVSGPQVSEGWHGTAFARPLRRTREYVEIVRAALARDLHGRHGRQGQELLRRAGRALRPRGVGPPRPGAVLRRRPRGRRQGAQRRADRGLGDRLPPGRAGRPLGRVRAGGRDHAAGDAVRRPPGDRRGASRRSCALSRAPSGRPRG